MRVLLAAALLLAPLAPASGEACPEVPLPLALLRGEVQDDAETGADASDCATQATVLPLGQEYSWGVVEVDGVPGVNDVDDWYAQDLRAAFRGDPVMVNVSAILPPVYTGITAVPPLAMEHFPFVVDIYAPGATGVTHRVSSCGPGVWLRDPAPGLWRFHVQQQGPAEAVPCTGAYLPGQPTNPPPVATYGVYRGCNPLCRAV